MIVGLSAAALQGAPVVTQDIDLWFEDLEHKGIQKALRKCHAIYIPPIQLNPPMFAGGKLELFDIVLTVDGVGEFQEEFKNAIEIALKKTKIKVMPLERIIASKKSANRKKDQLVLPVLKNALATLKGLKKRKL